MLDSIYYRFVRKLITRKDEHNTFSGGLWPRLVREKAEERSKGLTGVIADLGCGEGLFLLKLAENNPKASILGVEFREEVVQMTKASAAARPNIEVVQGDILSSGRPDSSLDRAFCLNTVINLPSFEDVRRLFREVHRILKPGGTFVFDVRNALNPLIYLQYRFVKYYDPGIQVPTNAYGEKKIAALLQETGFSIKEKQYLDILPAQRFSPVIFFTAEKR